MFGVCLLSFEGKSFLRSNAHETPSVERFPMFSKLRASEMMAFHPLFGYWLQSSSSRKILSDVLLFNVFEEGFFILCFSPFR